MRLSEVEKKARQVGIRDTWRYSRKELIKNIQRNEGNIECFDTATKQVCNQDQCCWRPECVR